MTELDLLIDLHRNSERQGPGSDKETLKALDLTGLQNKKDMHIADIGCGTGGPTLALALRTGGHFTAVDLFSQFLEELNQKAKRIGLSRNITTLEASMDELPFEKNHFDLIWSEGAVYNIGFETGITMWRDYLKPGGCLAVSELTWISLSRPKEIEEFWTREYPEIDLASNKIRILEENGYTLTGYFYLSEKSWIENYYKPLEADFRFFLERHNYSGLAKKVVHDQREEMNLYQTYHEHYSYGFYIARKS